MGNGCSPRNGASLLTPPYNCVGLSPRAPSVARSVHRYSSSLPRRFATRRLRVGHFRPIGHTGSPHSQPRAGTHTRPLGHDGRTRIATPRAALYLRRDTSGRTSLVQSRSPDLLRWRPGLPRQPIANSRAVNSGDPWLPSPAYGTLRRVPPRRWASRRSRARLALPRAVIRPSRVLRRSGHSSRAPNQGTQERAPRHASNARHVRPSPRYRERSRLELARTPGRSVICQRVRLRDEVRADSPRQVRRRRPPKHATFGRLPTSLAGQSGPRLRGSSPRCPDIRPDARRL